MALSDTCAENALELSLAFINYASWDYSLIYWCDVLDAIFKLTDVAVTIDAAMLPPELTRNNRLTSHKRVIDDLMRDRDNYEELTVALPVMAQVAKIHPRFREAIEDVYNWRHSPEGVAAILRYDYMTINVDPLYKQLHQQ